MVVASGDVKWKKEYLLPLAVLSPWLHLFGPVLLYIFPHEVAEHLGSIPVVFSCSGQKVGCQAALCPDGERFHGDVDRG